MQNAWRNGTDVRALRTAAAAVGTHTGRGAKIKLAPRAKDAFFARAGNVEIYLPYLMHSLQTNDNAKPVDASVKELRGRAWPN